MDDVNLRKLLVEKYDYPNFMVDDVIIKINNFSPDWLKAFEVFLSEGTIPDTICEGYTIKKMVNDMGMIEVGAFLTMDALMKDSETTLKMLIAGIK